MRDYLSAEVEQGGRFLVRTSIGKQMELSHWQEIRHSNGNWEFHLLLSGKCLFCKDEKERPMAEGDLAVIAPGVYHGAQSLPGEFCRLTLIVNALDGNAGQRLADCVGGCRILKQDSEMLQLGRLLMRESEVTGDFKVAEALLTVVFSYMLRSLGLSEKTKRTSGKDADTRTDVVDAFFTHHHGQGASEKDLAQRLGLSRRQLVRVLYEKYGMSFREKLVSTRMSQAAWLLSSTNLSVSEISSSVGYASETAFFHQFRRAFSVTPAEYRKNNAAS